MLRTHTCGELNDTHVGQKVSLCGWIDALRDHGGLKFIDLRDRYGKTQLVAPAASFPGGDYKIEDCIQVKGTVQRRPAGTENPKIPTGGVEVLIEEIPSAYHSPSAALPFEIAKSLQTNEELRMKYRYLDLRNARMQENLILRHRVYQAARRVLDRHGFLEVETPILTKSTPEGARDYLVPSRLNPGEFYALPQSPQLFKQILMVAGFDRYFQIARCFRDEDLRADRQPEFTQLDIEMSFLEENDLFGIVEEALAAVFEALGRSLKTPFPRLTHTQALQNYGTDKPDLRFDMKIKMVSSIAGRTNVKIFTDIIAGGGSVLGICVSQGASVSRKDMDLLREFAKNEGALGLADFKVAGKALESPLAKNIETGLQNKLIDEFEASDGDLILLIADGLAKALKVAGALRLYISKWRNLAPPNQFEFAWITDFPLFKYNEEEKKWDSEHHPFTSPDLEDWEKYRRAGELGKIKSRAYDLVLNGSEIASGSVRIHKKELQKQIFETIGLEEKEVGSRFGFLLRAFEFGPPPHGGIALGLDRVIAILLGLDSIRDAIAFPKNQKAADPMTDAPSPVDERQLKELGINIR